MLNVAKRLFDDRVDAPLVIHYLVVAPLARELTLKAAAETQLLRFYDLRYGRAAVGATAYG